MSAVSRAEAAERGRRAEQAVADYLIRSGYEVIGRNVHVGHLEVDILARMGSVVCVVEVRYRSPNSWQTPFESIGAVKQRRLRRAAERLWRERYARDCTVDRIRFDIAAVAFVDGQSVVDYVEGGM